MDNKSNKPSEDDHHQLPSNDAIRNKIDKHLSDKDDTISEEDMKNINTSTGVENAPIVSHTDPDEENLIDKKDDEEEDPKKEMPTSWDILS